MVTLFTSKNDDFLIIVVKSEITFLLIILQTPSPLSPYPPFRVIVCPSVLVNSAAKIFLLSLGCHPLDDVTLGGPTLPPSDASGLVNVKLKVKLKDVCDCHKHNDIR